MLLLCRPKRHITLSWRTGANFPKRDAVDARIVKSVQTGKAIYVENAPGLFLPTLKKIAGRLIQTIIITDIRQVGGLPRNTREHR